MHRAVDVFVLLSGTGRRTQDTWVVTYHLILLGHVLVLKQYVNWIFFFSNVYLFIHHTCMRDLVIISTAKQCRLCANKTLKKNTGLYTTQRVCKYTTVMYTRKELYCMITCIYTYRKTYVRGTRLYTRVCLYSFQGWPAKGCAQPAAMLDVNVRP